MEYFDTLAFPQTVMAICWNNNFAGWLGSQHAVINERSLLLNYHLASKHAHFHHLVLHHGNQ